MPYADQTINHRDKDWRGDTNTYQSNYSRFNYSSFSQKKETQTLKSTFFALNQTSNKSVVKSYSSRKLHE